MRKIVRLLAGSMLLLALISSCNGGAKNTPNPIPTPNPAPKPAPENPSAFKYLVKAMDFTYHNPQKLEHEHFAIEYDAKQQITKIVRTISESKETTTFTYPEGKIIGERIKAKGKAKENTVTKLEGIVKHNFAIFSSESRIPYVGEDGTSIVYHYLVNRYLPNTVKADSKGRLTEFKRHFALKYSKDGKEEYSKDIFYAFQWKDDNIASISENMVEGKGESFAQNNISINYTDKENTSNISPLFFYDLTRQEEVTNYQNILPFRSLFPKHLPDNISVEDGDSEQVPVFKFKYKFDGDKLVNVAISVSENTLVECRLSY